MPYDPKQKDRSIEIAKAVAAMVKKVCPKHPYASEFKNGPPIFKNNDQYQVRFRTERDKLLKECNCKDPEPK
jgi:ribosomal protein S30